MCGWTGTAAAGIAGREPGTPGPRLVHCRPGVPSGQARRLVTTPAGFERTGYIGVPTIDGVDVVKLSAATRITVTGP